MQLSREGLTRRCYVRFYSSVRREGNSVTEEPRGWVCSQCGWVEYGATHTERSPWPNGHSCLYWGRMSCGVYEFLGHIFLVNKTAPHNKFYRIQFFAVANTPAWQTPQWYVIMNWGGMRHPSGNSQKKKVAFGTRERAVRYLHNNLKMRMEHGYCIEGIPTLNLSLSSI